MALSWARSALDAKTLASLFVENAKVINVTGKRVDAFEQPTFRTQKVKRSVESIRFLSPDLAAVDVTGQFVQPKRFWDVTDSKP